MATSETVHVFEYNGGNVPGFGPFKRGQRVSIPLSHPLYTRCISQGRGTWKEVGRLPGRPRPKQAEKRKGVVVGVPTLAQVKAAGYSDDAAAHIVKVRTRMAELVADGAELAEAEAKAQAELGELPGAPTEIKRPAPDAPPAGGDTGAGGDDSDDGEGDPEGGDSGGGADGEGDDGEAKGPDVATRMAKAMKKAAIVRLGKALGADFKPTQREKTIARAIVAKLGGEEAALKNPTVAAALAGSDD